MSRLLVKLPGDRDRCGTIALLDDQGRTICGPFAVAGRSSSALAAANHNRTRFSLLPYGDTPTGTYAVRGCMRSGAGTPLSKAEFGSAGAIVLEGVGGDAALADSNGRFSILVQGGDASDGGLLRSTAGGLRMANADLRSLIRAVEGSACKRCEIVKSDRSAGAPVFDDDSCALPDPVPSAAMHRAPSEKGGGFHLPRRGTVLMVMGASFVAQSQVNAAPVKAAIASQPRSPAPRDIQWIPLASGAVQPTQAYNPPPDTSQQQQAAPQAPQQEQAAPVPTQESSTPSTPSASPTLETIQNGGNTGVIFENSSGQAGSDVNVGGSTNVPPVSAAPVPSGGEASPGPQSPSVQTPSSSTPGDAAYQHYLQKNQQQQQDYKQRAQQVIQQINQQPAAPAAAAPTAPPPPPAPAPPQKKNSEDYKIVKPSGSPERGR